MTEDQNAREQEALQRNQELESAERAFSNMLSGVGTPEFVADNKDLNPFRKFTPAERMLADAITEQIVSHDPDVASASQPQGPIQNQDIPVDEEGLSAEAPDGALIDSIDLPDVEVNQESLGESPLPDETPELLRDKPVDVDLSSPLAKIEVPDIIEDGIAPKISFDGVPKPPPGKLMPGLGREATPEEKKAVDKVADNFRKNPAILKEKSRRGQQARLDKAREDRLERRGRAATPDSTERGVGSDFFGDLMGDAGDIGDTFFANENDASPKGLSDAAGAAADALSIAADANIAILQRVSSVLLKHVERINALMDKLDVDDAEDDL